jgi:hypothetical protein
MEVLMKKQLKYIVSEEGKPDKVYNNINKIEGKTGFTFKKEDFSNRILALIVPDQGDIELWLMEESTDLVEVYQYYKDKGWIVQKLLLLEPKGYHSIVN